MCDMPYNKFKGYLAERGIKHKDIAELIGTSATTFSKKINRNDADFTADELRLICSFYKISSDEFFLS